MDFVPNNVDVLAVCHPEAIARSVMNIIIFNDDMMTLREVHPSGVCIRRPIQSWEQWKGKACNFIIGECCVHSVLYISVLILVQIL